MEGIEYKSVRSRVHRIYKFDVLLIIHSLTYTHPQHVKPDIVKLLVIKNLMLQPCSDVYILSLSFIDYRVERRKQGRTEVVPMPSD